VSKLLSGLGKARLWPYFIHVGTEAEMGKKETAIQRAARNVGLDVSLQDIVDSMEGELLVS